MFSIKPFDKRWMGLLSDFNDNFMREFNQPVSGNFQVDVVEDKDSYSLQAVLPGMKKEDIKLSIHDGILSIEGERKNETKVEEGNFTRFESYYGSFQRSFQLPEATDAEKIQAKYENGILHLVIPKITLPDPQTKQITIE